MHLPPRVPSLLRPRPRRGRVRLRSRVRPVQGRAAEAGRGRDGPQPPRPGAGQPDHRRLDLPGEPRPLLHPAVRRGVPGSVQAGLEEAAARRFPTRSSASSASGAASAASRGSTRASRTRRASAGSTATCPAGRSGSCGTSLKLVRELMMPNWDIHPEMVTHTWVIDTEDRPGVRRARREPHGELGLEPEQVGRRTGRRTWPTPSRS